MPPSATATASTSATAATAVVDYPYAFLPRAAYADKLAEGLARLIRESTVRAESLDAALAALCDAMGVPRGALTVERRGLTRQVLLSDGVRAAVRAANGDLFEIAWAGALVRLHRDATPDATAAKLMPALVDWPTTGNFALNATLRCAVALTAARDGVRDEPAFPVNVKSLGGGTVVIDVTPLLTVDALLQRLYSRLQLAHAVRVVYGGRQLDACRTLGSYGVRAHDTLHLLKRRHGHGKAGSKAPAALSGQCDVAAANDGAAVLLRVSKSVWTPEAQSGWEPFVTAASCAADESHYVLCVPLPPPPPPPPQPQLGAGEPTVRTLLEALAALANARGASSFPWRFALQPLADGAPRGEALLDVALSALRAVGSERAPLFSIEAMAERGG